MPLNLETDAASYTVVLLVVLLQTNELISVNLLNWFSRQIIIQFYQLNLVRWLNVNNYRLKKAFTVNQIFSKWA